MTILGEYPPIERRLTGFPSLDKALSNGKVGKEMELGQPLRCSYHIYGWSSVGKTSLGIALGAAMDINGSIAVAEVEGRLNLEYLQTGLDMAGFSGKAYVLPRRKLKKGEFVTDEEMMQEFVGCLEEQEFTAGLWDSLGGILTIGEDENDPGEGYGAKRASVIWDLLRKTQKALRRGRQRDWPAANAYFMNHQMDNLQGRGTKTAGGHGPEFLCSVHLKLWSNKKYDDGAAKGCQEIKGKVHKLTYGPLGSQFNLFLIPNYGVHAGLSAMVDCAEFKIVERKSHGIFMDGVNLGRLGTLLQAAMDDKAAPFKPFFKAMDVLYRTGSIGDAAKAGVDVSGKRKKPAARKGTKK